MPSKTTSRTSASKRKTAASTSKASRPTKKTQQSPALIAFYPIVVLALVMWVLYRSLLQSFPVWFDESIGKAIFFGFPVWLYIVMSRSKSIVDTFSARKLYPGLFLGLAAGGMFGFATSILVLLQTGAQVLPVALFSSEVFWGEFILAILTGFWETLLFFSFIMTVIMEKYPKWSVVSQAALTASIFLIFHIPNMLTQVGAGDVLLFIPYLMVMFLFGLGQAFLFYARRNAYALVLSHAIWGMVLLTHTW
ncbi:MAG: CPBP family glutamic-type intramembrane protease [Patescibacteria group bacterium]